MTRIPLLGLALLLGSPGAMAWPQGATVGIGGSPHLVERIQGRRKADELGGKGTAKALDAALDWIVRHQNADGGWTPTGSPAPGGRCKCVSSDLESPPTSTLDATALALLALQGAGLSITSAENRETMQRGIQWLSSQVDEIAVAPQAVRARVVLVFVEAWDHSRSPLLRKRADTGLKSLEGLALDAPEALLWVAQCVHAAERAGLEVPELRAAVLERLGSEAAVEVEQVFARRLLGSAAASHVPPDALAIQDGASPATLFLLQNAARLVGAAAFARTNPVAGPRLVEGLLKKPLCAQGAWADPAGQPAGLEATAWAALTLEVSFRLPAPN